MIISKDLLRQAIPRLSQHRILVIGDVILDEYLTGTATRLSREAPIPVLEFETRRVIPGGAANPAMNVAALGSQVTQIGLVGDDAAGEELINRLYEANIDASGIVVDKNRCTTQKTRLISQGSLRFPQQLARLDRVDRHPPDPTIEIAIISQLKIAAPTSKAILVSDYRNGLLTPAIVEAILAEAVKNGCLLLVDSQGNLDKYQGYHIIRANRPDTEAYFKRPLQTEADYEAATAELLAQLKTKGIVIGRGPQGVSLQGCDIPYHHFRPANVTEVFDVTGAGDTSIAVLTLGLVAGLGLAQAALLANYAAGLVVQKLGNATPTPDELMAAIDNWG
jgi:rfaE bifunctional protein kinase chain/domain